MMDEEELVRCLNDELGPVSIEKEILDDIKTSPSRIATATGRDFEVEMFLIPNPQGGLAILSEIVRFSRKAVV